MIVYSWGKKKRIINLAECREAEFGFYIKELFKNKKKPSIQIRTEKEKICFPVDAYSIKQIRTILFILNNYLNTKLHDDRLQGQEKYLRKH